MEIRVIRGLIRVIRGPIRVIRGLIRVNSWTNSCNSWKFGLARSTSVIRGLFSVVKNWKKTAKYI